MVNKRLSAFSLAIVGLLFLMADRNLQTINPATPVDIGQTITTVGQYGLLAWLIIRAEARQAEQQKAWRDERRWLVELAFKVKDRTPDE